MIMIKQALMQPISVYKAYLTKTPGRLIINTVVTCNHTHVKYYRCFINSIYYCFNVI